MLLLRMMMIRWRCIAYIAYHVLRTDLYFSDESLSFIEPNFLSVVVCVKLLCLFLNPFLTALAFFIKLYGKIDKNKPNTSTLKISTPDINTLMNY